MRAIVDVVRTEGVASAMRRAYERLDESRLRWSDDAEIVNVAPGGIGARTGGVAVQLLARLRAERAMRNVALQTALPADARAVHLEGTSGVDFAALLRLRVPLVVSVHDFSLFCARPHLLEQPHERFCFYSRDLDRCARCLPSHDQARHRELARELLQSARAVIFSSQFLRDMHRELFALPQLGGEVIEVAVSGRAVDGNGERRGVAFVGSVKPHKGSRLLPEIARMLAARGIDLHVFGGGELAPLHNISNVRVHGYYRHATLPSLLARRRIGLVLLPSIWPETYGIVLSEAWLGGSAVAAFDLGALAQRIREHGGGWLVPLESGAAGLVEIVDRWRSGEAVTVPRAVQWPDDAARAHVALYRRLGLL